MIQALHKKGMSLRGIAKSVGCAHTTIYYELKRGTPPRKSKRGRIPGYTAKRGQEAYAANRKRSKRPCKIDRDDCEPFIQWMCERIRKDRWSIDGCVGAARLMKSFPGRTIPCTKTLYNMLLANKLPLSLFNTTTPLIRRPEEPVPVLQISALPTDYEWDLLNRKLLAVGFSVSSYRQGNVQALLDLIANYARIEDAAGLSQGLQAYFQEQQPGRKRVDAMAAVAGLLKYIQLFPKNE